MPEAATPILRLGIIADPQYAPIAPNPELGRYFRQSLDKLRTAIAFFEQEDLDLIVVLGDLIDRDWDNFDPVLDILATSRHEVLCLPGNHDFAVAADKLAHVHAKIGMPSPYYDRVVNGVRLIVTDGSEISLFAPPLDDERRIEASERLKTMTKQGAANAMMWNAGMSETQVAWLQERLTMAAQAGEKAIVLGHYPLHPFTDHALWDAPGIAELIAAPGAAVAYLCGHDHRGNYGQKNATHFINFKGMVDTEDENAFAIFQLYADHIHIDGLGREESRRLPVSR